MSAAGERDTCRFIVGCTSLVLNLIHNDTYDHTNIILGIAKRLLCRYNSILKSSRFTKDLSTRFLIILVQLIYRSTGKPISSKVNSTS